MAEGFYTGTFGLGVLLQITLYYSLFYYGVEDVPLTITIMTGLTYAFIDWAQIEILI